MVARQGGSVQKLTAVATLGAAALLWVAVSAQQEMQPRPGPGSGIMNVTGSVSVENTPAVTVANTPAVRQEGDWRVAINNTPSVRVTEVPSPGFLRTGGRYEITWVDGTRETVTVSSIATNGWIEVERSRRWINLTSARSIAEAR
jgi:hypothetical protein